MVIYPDTPSGDDTVELAGLTFPDPYHWLESNSADVERWQHEQARVASAHVRAWPHYDRLRQLVARYSTERYVALPRYCGGRWFRTCTLDGATQAQVVTADSPTGAGPVLFDPKTEDPDRPPFVSWIAPSLDGKTLAVGLCSDGSENNTIRLIDVLSGDDLPAPPAQTIMDGWTGGVHWLPDSSGFFFSAISGRAIEFEQEVYLHRRRPEPTTVRLDVPWMKSGDYRMVMVSHDHRLAVALEGLTNLAPVAVASLADEPMRWRPFVTSITSTIAGHVIGDRYIGVTNVNAPRGRLVAIDLGHDQPTDPDGWRELVGESEAVMRTVTPIGKVLYLTEFRDTYSQVRIVDLDGQELRQVPLPGRGAVHEWPFPLMNLVPKGHPERFLFAFSTLRASPGIYSHSPGQQSLETLQPPQVSLDRAVVEDRWAVSRDGTRVPYHLLRRDDVSGSGPQPTLMYAYGGFNVPLTPQFPGAMAAIVAAGGVFVHAHLRGGGEFGVEWWQGGSKRNKQNTYDDLFAVAEDLIASKRSAPHLLSLTGHSNGGLTAGVAITQRPDLWAVVVPRVPVLDLIGDCQGAYGHLATLLDRADVDDPEEVRRLVTFSPYHLVREGVRYPAVFLDAGATDPRCPPWHARKFAARLQRASAAPRPILLHIWKNVGHGWATDREIALSQNTDWLAFVMSELELVPD